MIDIRKAERIYKFQDNEIFVCFFLLFHSIADHGCDRVTAAVFSSIAGPMRFLYSRYVPPEEHCDSFHILGTPPYNYL